MSNIKNYIHQMVSPDSVTHGGGLSATSFSTKDMLAEFYKMRPPLWTVVGGAHATGVSRLLEELARLPGTGANSHNTLRVVLPDEVGPRILIGKGVSQQ